MKKNLEKTRVQEGQQMELEPIETVIPSDFQLKPTSPQLPIAKKQIHPLQQFSIKSYSIKGKGIFSVDPLYEKGSVIQKQLNTFTVKAYNEEKSEGLKMIWESMVGYAKRQLLIEDGFLYLFETTKNGLLAQSNDKIADVLKVFVDEENMVRFVFREEGGKLKNKNFKIQRIDEFMEKLKLEVNIMGLEMVFSDDYF